jgi:O-6-methylguanine DNA methyltransferase
MDRAEPYFEFDAAAQERYATAFEALLGPKREQIDGAIAVQWVASPVGPLVIGASFDAIVLVEFSSQERLDAQFTRLRGQFREGLVHAKASLLDALRAQLDEYFASRRRSFDVPLYFGGSDFQHQVWSALRDIPYGETCSYGAIAKRVGDPKAVRAVGAANGLNPIAIVIPCHRVVNANGELGGYGGGLWRKRKLLDLERGQGSLF